MVCLDHAEVIFVEYLSVFRGKNELRHFDLSSLAVFALIASVKQMSGQGTAGMSSSVPFNKPFWLAHDFKGGLYNKLIHLDAGAFHYRASHCGRAEPEQPSKSTHTKQRILSGPLDLRHARFFSQP